MLLTLSLSASALHAQVEDGYDLWLRYRPIAPSAQLTEYRAALRELAIDTTSSTSKATRDELVRGIGGLLGTPPAIVREATRGGTLVVGTPASSSVIAALQLPLKGLGDEGYVLRATTVAGKRAIIVAGNTDVGALYGAFALLRRVQTGRPVAGLAERSAPSIRLRMLDHWDNLDRSVERGYAGKSLWAWDSLPDVVNPRYRDYARANASIGINAAVLTNVNANARVLTPAYLAKVAAIASVLRPYGERVFLTARFSAPIEIGGLKTADPLDPAVRQWWKAKADEIWATIPDFGGFVVKANSEGQPGPQDYKRTHADGANMLADAVASHGGIVLWRAFVYGNTAPTDRIRQAYDEFMPLDGQFAANVIVQVKNGPLDFQPREPFSPLFGAMRKTPVALELQVTKEYLGQDTHLVWLGQLFSEVLRADTWRRGKGTPVSHTISAIAGVANVGTDRDWTGSHFNQANWYAYGRLAWNPDASPDSVAAEWVRQTWSSDPRVASRVTAMMRTSREAVVNYMTPLGLAHIMATGHHYGPGPWVANAGRADWNPVYFHRADSLGIGFDRTATGSNAIAQYAAPIQVRWGNRATAPDSVLLWFHHVGWSERVPATHGRTLWNELVHRYDLGVDSVRAMQRTWRSLQGRIDSARFADVDGFLTIQEREARWWRGAALSYFQTFSRMPLPAGSEPIPHTLDYYEHVRCPSNVNKPRCDLIP